MTPERDDGDLYEMAGERVPARPPVAPSARPNAKNNRVLAYQAAEKSNEFDPERLKNLHAPLALFAGGLLIQVAMVYWRSPGDLNELALELVTSSVLMLAVFRGCAWWRGFEFGKVSDAVLKVLAISVAPTAAVHLLSLVLWIVPFGWLGAWLAGLCFYFALVGYFFDLDQDDTWYCVIALFITSVAVAVLTALFMA